MIKLHARDRKPSQPYFTSYRLPIAVAQGIDVRAQAASKQLGKRVSYSEAVTQVLEQFVAGTKAPRGFKSALKPSKHARDPYNKKPVKKVAKKAKAKFTTPKRASTFQRAAAAKQARVTAENKKARKVLASRKAAKSKAKKPAEAKAKPVEAKIEHEIAKPDPAAEQPNGAHSSPF